ncbi:hypothetical protein XCR_2784 [Xanthomonas campestris pv. raphani 756C]|nr:hypothetical protein XCR_2784 [Xanthomonas campestris pv. raphani 756C]
MAILSAVRLWFNIFPSQVHVVLRCFDPAIAWMCCIARQDGDHALRDCNVW